MRNQELPAVGKISPEIFSEIIFPQLGKPSKKLLVGPQHGVDAGIIDIGGGKVMAVTTDPFFIVPEYGWERAAWFAVHILASDISTTGLAPEFMSIDLNLPMSITRDELAQLWSAVHTECVKLGITVVTGHTAKYNGCNYPMVGGCTMMATGDIDKFVTPAMAQPGDVVLMTKGAAIEAAGIFAVTFRERIAQEEGPEFADRAEKIFYQMSTVEDALTLASVGLRENGVTAMHDATECGVYGGLYEIANASGVGMTIEKEKIILADEIDTICRMFGMDPYISISEGTLLATCRPAFVNESLKRLKAQNIDAAVIGEITPDAGNVFLIEDGKKEKLDHPRVDPFWEAFAQALGG